MGQYIHDPNAGFCGRIRQSTKVPKYSKVGKAMKEGAYQFYCSTPTLGHKEPSKIAADGIYFLLLLSFKENKKLEAEDSHEISSLIFS